MFSKCAGKRTKEDIVIFTFYLCNTYCGKLKKTLLLYITRMIKIPAIEITI